MHKLNEDCFYFLTSSCAKGSSCSYRHSPLALTCNVVCPSWIRGNCLDPACPYRHSAVQRPMVSNGILCFYENTPTGCLKLDCTFVHSRPRVNLRNTPTNRPLSTNLIKKDVVAPIVTNTLPNGIPQTTHISGSDNSPSQQTNSEIQSSVLNATLESSSTVKSDIIPRRIAIPSDPEQTNEIKNLSDNNNNSLSSIKTTTRSVITDTPKTDQQETTTTPSRLIINRNVVIAEPTNVPNRKIVQTTPPSSNRVVVSSHTVNSSLKEKKNEADFSEQENNTKRFKPDPQSMIDISFAAATPTIINRLPFATTKETTSTDDTKPIRLNRHRLPASKPSHDDHSSVSVSKPFNEEKLSAGTGLSQNDERRTMRIERFQKKPVSPPRSVISSPAASTTSTNNMTTNPSTTRNVVTSAPNQRKRTAPETTTKSALPPPPKRISASLTQHQSTLRHTNSSPDMSPHSTSASIRDKNWQQQTDEFIAKTAQRKTSSSTTTPPQSQSRLTPVVRPRFTPQPIVAPSLQPTSSTKTPRLRQPPSVVIKRPLVPVTAPAQISMKPIEQTASNDSANHASSLKATVEHQISNNVNEEDENQLLELNESADVVDTFALIDEALLEADHLLELM